MAERVIAIEGLWKQYRYGTVSHRYLFKDMQSWWARTRGRDDPNAKIDASRHGAAKGQDPETDRFWALQDINFTIMQGEVVGIIGRNGAGKSTLLKILSRVTAPTKGIARIRGRIGSLLEVGTGFHPELTGRENIFLNGAILGMRKAEIRKKFDEIVAFAEVEKFIDTPVKRYSSGMYVRLAFAVAAHLDPEILVIDEVLAVGDAQFQKKCLGKMGDVSRNEGRTVLFVSHNMAAIQRLCRNVVCLDKGVIVEQGQTDEIVSHYLKKGTESSATALWDDPARAPGNEKAILKSVKLLTADNLPADMCDIDHPIMIEIEYLVHEPDTVLNLSISVFNQDDTYILASPSISDPEWFQKNHPAGLFRSRCLIPPDIFNQGRYSISVLLVENGRLVIGQADRVVSVDMTDSGLKRGNYFGYWGGVVRPLLEWNTSFVKPA